MTSNPKRSQDSSRNVATIEEEEQQQQQQQDISWICNHELWLPW
jgi:hypothetical protein